MQSPLHPQTQLQEKEIEPGLRVFECPVSGGIWITLQSYVHWQAGDMPRAKPLPSGYTPKLTDDSGRRALLCPESGCILLRYRVGHDLSFHIDRSPVTGGVWLDKGEWDALKSVGLASQMHLIFTAHYQAGIRSAELHKVLEQTFRDRIGAADFLKVQEIRNWLVTHPKRRDIICYLLEDSHKPSEAFLPSSNP